MRKKALLGAIAVILVLAAILLLRGPGRDTGQVTARPGDAVGPDTLVAGGTEPRVSDAQFQIESRALEEWRIWKETERKRLGR